MVIAAPIALLAYSRRFRQFASSNRQGLFNLGMGSFAFVLALRNIAKEVGQSFLGPTAGHVHTFRLVQFQMKDLQQAHDNKQSELHTIRKLLNSDDFAERISGDAGECLCSAYCSDTPKHVNVFADLTSEQRATVVQAVKQQFNFVKDRSEAMYEMRSEPMGPMMTVVNRITAKFRAPVSLPPSDAEAPPLAPAAAPVHTQGAHQVEPASGAAVAPKLAASDVTDEQGQVKGWL